MDLCLKNINDHFQLTCKEIDNHKLSCCSAVREGDIAMYMYLIVSRKKWQMWFEIDAPHKYTMFTYFLATTLMRYISHAYHYSGTSLPRPKYDLQGRLTINELHDNATRVFRSRRGLLHVESSTCVFGYYDATIIFIST